MCCQRGNPRGCAICLLVSMSCFGLIGIILIPVGVAAAEEAKLMDPSADFTLLENGCLIKGVVHETTEKTDDNGRNEDTTRCADKYTYRYEVIAGEGWEEFDSTYSSDPSADKLWRCDEGENCKCESTSQRYPTEYYAVNETVDCWVPTDDPDDLNSGYDCTHSDCVKLDDPKEDKEDNLEDAEGMIVGGSVMLTLSVIGCAGAAAMLSCARKQEMAQQQQQQQPYGVPQQQYGVPQQQYGVPQQQYGVPQQQYPAPMGIAMQGVQPQGVVLGQQPTFSFVVPPGAGLGTTLTVQAPNSQTVQVAVPPGTSPGASLTVAMPPAPVVASQPAPIQGMVVSEPPPSYAESGPLEGTVVSEPESLSAPGEVNHKGLIVARVVS